MTGVRELKLARALPALLARLGRESSGFSAGPRRRLQEAIDALKADGTPSVAELEAQAAELETRARDLRSRISTLKQSRTSGPADPAAKGTGPSH
jgi:hypothetical protein